MKSTYLAVAILLPLLAGGAGRTTPPDVPPAAETAREPRHVSLLIGISDYQYFEEMRGEQGLTDLNGPRNDVDRMQFALRRFGFGNERYTQVRVDTQASRQGIASAFEWLGTVATDSSDVVVIFYAGHGSWARDGSDGDESALIRGDTLDEALVPYDARNIHDPAQLVLDDQIRAWLGRLPTSNVTLIVDACYSGTISRGAEGHGVLQRGPPPPEAARPPTRTVMTPAVDANLELLVNPRHVLLTAARADQTSIEKYFAVDDRSMGVFTESLARVLNEAGGALRYDEVIERVRASLREAGHAQVPQVEGDRGALLFRVREPVAMSPFTRVTPLGSGRYRLDAGARHGVRARAVFDVHAPGDTRLGGAPVGQLRVDSVRESESFATALSAALIAQDARATLSRVPITARTLDTLPVYVAREARQLVPALRDSFGLIRVVADSNAAQTWITMSGGRAEVRFNQIPLPLRRGDPGGNHASGLCDRLSRAFALASFDLIRNPVANRDFGVQLRFVRRGAPNPNRRADVDTVYVDSLYDILAKVDAPGAGPSTQLYLSAAFAGYTDSVIVLWPRPGRASAPFALDSWEPLALRVKATEPTGMEVVKVVVNGDPFDFTPLVASFPRCRPRTREVLARGEPDEPRWSSAAAPITGWISLEHHVVILSGSAQARR